MLNIFYGWKLCMLCSLGNLLIQGGAMYGMNAFLEPLCDAYGWSRTALSLSMGASALFGFASAPILGTIAMKIPLKMMMALGAAAGSLSFVGMGQTDSIWLFTFFFCLLWASGQCCGGMVANALMCRWFAHHRGEAFGLAAIGTSLSGAVIPFIAMICLSNFGIGPAFIILGLITASMIPLSLLLVQEQPADMNLHPDGAENDPPHGSVQAKPTDIKTMLRRKEIYLIGLSLALGLMCASGIMSQLKPRFSELGLTPYHSMLLMSLAALCCGLSKFIWGWLCDKFSPMLIARILLFANMLILASSILPMGNFAVAVYSIVLGTGCGGYWTVIPAVVSYYFGSANFLSAYRLVSFFIVLKAMAYPIIGLSFDLTGSYNSGYLVYSALVGMGFILILFVNEKKSAEYGSR
ncbi:MAG: MFS transporter [Desulfovibrionaceae bacterium]|nr:MFS transporter [Desulfovibrionaceae bacterium]